MRKGQRKPIRERIYSRLVRCADPGCDCDGCMLWTGAVDTCGYGVIRVDGRATSVHRSAWKLECGPVPDGLVLDHVWARGCRHKNCGNVAHLEPVTQRENILRGSTIIAAEVAATHCPKKHAYDAANTYITPRGKRVCRRCARQSRLRWSARRLAAASP